MKRRGHGNPSPISAQIAIVETLEDRSLLSESSLLVLTPQLVTDPNAPPEIISPQSGDFDGALEVRWNPVEGAEAYEVGLHVYTDDGNTDEVETFAVDSGTSLTLSDEIMHAGEDYLIGVRAIFTGDVSRWAYVSVSDISEGLRAAAGTWATASHDENPQIGWYWNQAPEPREVEVYVSAKGDPTNPVFRSHFEPESGQSSLTIPTHLDSGHYEVWVRGHFSDGTLSRWGRPKELSINRDFRSRPIVTVQRDNGIASTQWDISWNQSAKHISYDLRIAPRDDRRTPLVEINEIEGTSYRTETLPPDIYILSVRANLANGFHTQWTEQFVAVHDDGNNPIQIIGGVGQHEDRTPLIEWEPVSNARGYEIYIAPKTNQQRAIYHRHGLQESSHRVTTLLDDNTEYVVWVRAVLDSLYLGASHTLWGEPETITIGTPGGDSPHRIRFQQGTGANADLTPLLTWEARENVANYELWINEEGSPRVPVYHRTDLTTARHDVEVELDADKFYDVWVRAHYTEGTNTVWGHGLLETIDAAAAEQRQPIQFISGLDDSTDATPELIWEARDNVREYEVYVSVAGDPSTPAYRRRIWRENSHVLEETLSDDTQYDFWVRAHFWGRGLSRWGRPTAFATTTTVPDFDQERPVVSVQGNHITWSPIDMAAGYRLVVTEFYENQFGRPSIREVMDDVVTGTSFPLDFRAGDYSVEIQATDGMFGTRWSDEVTFTIDESIQFSAARPELSVIGNEATWLPLPTARSYFLWISRFDAEGQLIRPAVIRQRIDGLVTKSMSHQLSLPNGSYRGWLQAVSWHGEESSWSVAVDFHIGT